MDKVSIKNEKGALVEALAPVIISASRSTDIPAFYAKWFFNRLAKGYCVWYNPFNRKPYYVSFKRCRVIIHKTKHQLVGISLNAFAHIPYLLDQIVRR